MGPTQESRLKTLSNRASQKKTRKELLDKEDPPQMYAKRQKKDVDITHCNNQFGALTVDDQQANMDVQAHHNNRRDQAQSESKPTQKDTPLPSLLIM
ncbi:hypothetical protein TNCT_625491 [Trichonephila clavata]|uniref:Uncharacterized protein n=1 Tax=Trichonephila clavata TaxID=2740835 RepID=A0A8X6HHX9_TRICU|nr:hypothetical protein TNCT_625491 [Trichonephila clavata]